MKHLRLVIFAVLALVFIGLAVKTTFFHAPKCETFECFEEYLRSCKPANYLNDDPQATWRYRIQGSEGSVCVIEVTLLQSKTNEPGVDELAGSKMECGLPKGVVDYPERNLEQCHGRLKEEMQTIIIKKLHTYIIDNIGEIDDTLNLLVQQSS